MMSKEVLKRIVTVFLSSIFIAVLWVAIAYGAQWAFEIKDVGLAFWVSGLYYAYPLAVLLYFVLYSILVKSGSLLDKRNVVIASSIGVSYPIWPFLVGFYFAIVH